MLEAHQSKRPGCSEIIQFIENLSFRSEIKQVDLEEQLKSLKSFENKFFFNYLLEKSKPDQAQSNKLVENITIDDIPGPLDHCAEVDKYSIDGLYNYMIQVLSMAVTGVRTEVLKSIFKDMFGHIFQGRVKTEMVNFMEILTSCFTLVGTKIILNENRMDKIIKKWQQFVDSLKMIQTILGFDKLIIKKSNEIGCQPGVQNNPDTIYLKAEQFTMADLVNYPELKFKFESFKESTGVSAIFDAVSYSLYRSKEQSNLIRLLTMLKFFKYREEFKKYCEIVGDDYPLILLKILSAPEFSHKTSEKFKIARTNIIDEKSAILAIQLAIERKIMILPGLTENITEYSINPFTRNILNQRSVEV